MLKKSLIGVILTAVTVSSLIAKSSGDLPNGQPFLQIQKQFVAVNSELRSINEQVDTIIIDINSLEGRVGTLEDNVASMQSAITTLTANQDKLLADMEIAFSNIDQNRADINAAFDEVARLSDLVDALRNDTNANKAEIDQLMVLILAQQEYIAANTEGLAQINNDLLNTANLITELTNRVSAAEAELATKQDATTASCGEGQSLTKINPDGSYECSINSSGGLANFEAIGLKNIIVNGSGEIGGFTETKVQVTRYYSVRRCSWFRCYTYWYPYTVTETRRTPITDSSVSVSCPVNTMWTFDAGYELPSGVTLTSKKLTTDVDGIYTWTFNVNNPSGTVHNLNVSAQCVQKLEQAEPVLP